MTRVAGVLVISVIVMAASLSAQDGRDGIDAPRRFDDPLPRIWASPRATVSQRIGLTDVTVTYHRPAVNDREIWGDLVPYGQVWRAGANENTTITFAHDVHVDGQPLAAGTYGLHMVPGPDQWTVVFSRNATSWGSYFYDEADDTLRVDVTPEDSTFHERLTFDFADLSREGATCRLAWGDRAVPFRIEVDTSGVMVEYIRTVHLQHLPAFRWQGWYDAARFCAANDVNLDEALGWAERATVMHRSFDTLWVHSELLAALDRAEDAQAVRDEAVALATEEDLNRVGYELLAAEQLDRAIEVFTHNAGVHPESWNAQDSLAEAHARRGDIELAIELYTQALSLVDDPDQKVRMTRTLEALKAR
jgi:tetratricopeptide (TPR) repeat protein